MLIQQRESKSRLFLRADANDKIGYGHVMRLLALAEILRSDFTLLFIINNPDEKLRSQILKVCNDIILVEGNEVQLISNKVLYNDILVLDGYHFDEVYQKKIKELGKTIVYIDDLHQLHFYSDVIINHAQGVSSQSYSAEDYTRFYLGVKYALLRSPFLEAAREKRDVTLVDTAFINMGGSGDENNFTLKALKECLKSDVIRVINIVVGGAYKYRSELENFINTIRDKTITLQTNLSALEMVEVMKKSQVAICSASTVSYEYSCIGGLLFPIKTVDNQSGIFSFLIKEKLGEDITNFAQFVDDISIVKSCIDNQKSFFDGQSPKRLKKLFKSFELERKVDMREASEKDMLDYFNLANDPYVRENSINKDKIIWENHQKWFVGKLANENFFFYSFDYEGSFLGQVRFERSNDGFLISFSIDKEYRGYGLGEIILHKAILGLSEKINNSHVFIAFVQENNVASKNVFFNLGFETIGQERFGDEPYLKFKKEVPVKIIN